MIRDITLGQYYPVDSIIHRLDPRTKLFGTMVFIVSLFMADSLWGYLAATAVLAAVVRCSLWMELGNSAGLLFPMKGS